MKKHIVQPGEGLSKLAQRYGFAPETLWEHPLNASLQQLRRDGNVLLPGDELWIPEIRQKFVAVATGMRHVFRLKGVPAKLRLQLFKNEAPRRNVPFRLEIGAQVQFGVTDDTGFLECFVHPSAESGLLFVDEDPPARLLFGNLDPITELVGVQKRLRNLGYHPGPCDGRAHEADADAIRAFQRACDLPATGELDGATLAKLSFIHDREGAFPGGA